MTDQVNWEGLPGTPNEHRTVGPVRAWCYKDVEWCYSDPQGYCLCCDRLIVPSKYQGDYPGALLHDLHEQVEALHGQGASNGAWVSRADVLALLQGRTDD